MNLRNKYRAAFGPSAGLDYSVDETEYSRSRRIILDFATHRYDSFPQVQALVLIAALIGLLTVDWAMLALALAFMQTSEIIGLVFAHHAFKAAAKERIDTRRWIALSEAYEWCSALLVSAAFLTASFAVHPDFILAITAMWCLAMVFFTVPTMYYFRAMLGCIVILMACLIGAQIYWLVVHMVAPMIFAAQVLLAVFAFACALIIGCQMRNRYSEMLDREAELTEVARAVRKASQRKTAFLGQMSHEIRTPLNGILGTAALLAETPMTAEQKRLIDTVMASGRTLNKVVDEGIDMSRIESGALRMEKQPENLHHVLAEVVRLHRANIRSTKIQMSLRVDASLGGKFEIDAQYVQQVLGNLIVNAIKCTERGRIDIHAHYQSDANRVVIVVADTGIGMAADQVERMFDPYEIGSAGALNAMRSSGLGLTIVRDIVKQMGGDISVTSEPGKGTAFTVSFPAFPAGGARKPMTPAEFIRTQLSA